MTHAPLRPCPSCSRHVRASETACPFCAVALEPSLAPPPAPLAPALRLSRAALFALGTGASVIAPVLALDCDSGVSVQPLYGAVAVPPYGQVPFPEDGGEGPQDGAFVTPDVHVGNADAADGSVSAEDAGNDVADAGSSETDADGSTSDAAADAGDAD